MKGENYIKEIKIPETFADVFDELAIDERVVVNVLVLRLGFKVK